MRNERGQFTEGNPGGPGRPRRNTEEEYLTALSGAVSMDAWQAITRKAIEQATNGDSKARDWLTRHLIGEPEIIRARVNRNEDQRVDLSMLTDDELETLEKIMLKAEGKDIPASH